MDLDLVGLGWAGPKSSEVDQGHSTLTRWAAYILPRAWSTRTMPVARLPAMAERCLAAQECAILPAAAAMEGAKKWTNMKADRPRTRTRTRTRTRYAFFNDTRLPRGVRQLVRPTGSLIDNSGSHAASSWTVRIHPSHRCLRCSRFLSSSSLQMFLTVFSDPPPAPLMSPSAAARQFHA